MNTEVHVSSFELRFSRYMPRSGREAVIQSEVRKTSRLTYKESRKNGIDEPSAGRNREADIENQLFLSLQREQKLGKEPVPARMEGRATPPGAVTALLALEGTAQFANASEDSEQCRPPLPWEQWLSGPCAPLACSASSPWGPCFPSPLSVASQEPRPTFPA